jgi:hypothetical protein
LTLAFLGAVSYEGSFVHTDDGCQVEVHCLACRLALGPPTTAAVPTLDSTPPDTTIDQVVLPADAVATAEPTRSTSSRAPPFA